MQLTNEFFTKKMAKSDWISLLLTAFLTAIASEVKVIPFNGEALRFGLGSISFLLIILILPPASLIRTGIITGITVVAFRVSGDLMISPISFGTSLMGHLPVLLFYSILGLGYSIMKIEKYKTLPLHLGTIAAGSEFIGNSAEHISRYLLLNHAHLGLREWAMLLGVALFRSFFVVGLYSSITISEQKKRMQEMLKIGSELYAETLYLEKSMDHIEQITASSHDLYRSLKRNNLTELSTKALMIAQEIHEVKKDSQRILSGLSKISIQKKSEIVLLSDVLNFVITANEKYSNMLGKRVTFHLSSSVDFDTNQQISLLALLNNLTANAVEAIVDKGIIDIDLYVESEFTCFIIKDSGNGISKEDLSIIFEPGFTTKFNDHGVAATGIGLSHVQSIVHTLEGQIQLEPQEVGTVFRIKIPTKNIRKRVE